MTAIGSVTVFCSASESIEPLYYELATQTGARLAKAGIKVIYGGGKRGMMGRLADAAIQAGGEVIGVIPQALEKREVAHLGLHRLEICPDLLSRKERLLSLGDAFLILPGGLGTIDEFLEAVTHCSLGYHAKSTIVLDFGQFYSPLLHWIQKIAADGFIQDPSRCFSTAHSLDEALEQLRN